MVILKLQIFFPILVVLDRRKTIMANRLLLAQVSLVQVQAAVAFITLFFQVRILL